MIQSLKTNARTPVVNSKKKMIPRNTENCSRRKRTGHATFMVIIHNSFIRNEIKSHHGTYKLEKKCVFPQGSNASCKAKNEHHPPDHHEEPDRVQTPKVCDGGDVRQNPLRGETGHRTVSVSQAAAPHVLEKGSQ